MSTATDILDALLAAHGGRARWESVACIRASLSSGGLAFASHMQPNALRNLRIAVHPRQRMVILRDFGHPDWEGHWTPERVSLYDAHGRLVAERSQPRASFDRLLKQLAWDRLDILYFAGYALWNYLSFPWLLTQPGIDLIVAPGDAPGVAWRLLAHFDDSVPTHSARQCFHLDADYRLVRHDYTADVIGRWATAAHYCLRETEADGLRFYTRRKVFPRLLGGRWIPRFPTLVWIELDGLAVEFAP